MIAANNLKIKSPAFSDGDYIPYKHTCQGENVNPPIEFSGIPEKTSTLALIMEDFNEAGERADHWILWNIPWQVLPNKTIPINTAPGVEGKNSFGLTRYSGPCPSSGTREYVFKVFALDTSLNLSKGADKQTLLKAMKGHILNTAELTGRYKRVSKHFN